LIKWKKESKETLGIIGQWGSGFLLLVGITIELIYGAHIGFIAISTGGLGWGIFTKIRGR